MTQVPAKVLLAIAVALSIGCCITEYRPDFTFDVATTQRDGVAVSLDEKDVAFDWSVTRSDIKVTIHNRTANPIVIQWPSAIFVDFAGSSHGFGPRTEPQVVDVGQGSVEVVYPRDFEYARIGRRAVRSFQPALPTISSLDRSVAEEFGNAHVGDQAKIFLPIIVRGVPRTYVFSLRTTAFTITRICVS